MEDFLSIPFPAFLAPAWAGLGWVWVGIQKPYHESDVAPQILGMIPQYVVGGDHEDQLARREEQRRAELEEGKNALLHPVPHLSGREE